VQVTACFISSSGIASMKSPWSVTVDLRTRLPGHVRQPVRHEPRGWWHAAHGDLPFLCQV
jgi:hypothetical protein